MLNCPYCKLPRPHIGGRVISRDDAGVSFVFPVCISCNARLKTLPEKTRSKMLRTAIFEIYKHQDRYDFKTFDSFIQAELFAKLARNSQDAFDRL